jgi:hypothetical protein
MIHLAVDENVYALPENDRPFLIDLLWNIELMSWSGSAPMIVNDEVYCFVGKF